MDILVAPDGFVDSGTEGMSVVPPPVENLVDHRRPPDFGGTGKDPVFELDTEDLPGVLAYRPDPANPEGHGFIEPARRVSFEEYRRAIHQTRTLWRRLRRDVR
ncbi:MAG TPA: hypothetical protein VFY57_00060 [Rubrobacteraceae bacterium]|nr:hypothetical protein [Rubrobacteraceae bacterium]